MFWRGVKWARDQSVRFWWRSGFCRGSWIIFQDSLTLADRVQSDILQCISTNYERILMEFLTQRTIDFILVAMRTAILDLRTTILDPHHDPRLGFEQKNLFTNTISLDSEE